LFDVLSALPCSDATGVAHVSQAAQMALPALPPRSLQPREVSTHTVGDPALRLVSD
jgi:hypothetical protein